MKKFRIALAVIILAISVTLLIWGFSPNQHETLIRDIAPSEMQLPTPSSYSLSLS